MTPPPTTEWTKIIDADSNQWANSIMPDGNGGVFVAGMTAADLNGQGDIGGGDGFITNYNSSGEEIWTRIIGTDKFEYIELITSDGLGGILASGYTYGNINGHNNNGGTDVFISKIAGDGEEIWTKLIGSDGYESVNSIIPDSYGSFFVSGETSGNLNGQTNGGLSDIFLSKYNSNGEEVWTRLVGSSSADWSYAFAPIASDGNGGIYTEAQTFNIVNNGSIDMYLSRYNGEGEELWTTPIGTGTSGFVKSDGNGGVFVGGQTTDNLNGQINHGGYDGFIAHYNSNGEEVWTKLVGTDLDEGVNSIMPDGNGGVYIGGGTGGNLNGQINHGGYDGFIAHYNSNGEEVWTKLVGTSSFENINGIIGDEIGGLLITGETFGHLDGQINWSDIFVANYSTTGEELWAKTIGTDTAAEYLGLGNNRGLMVSDGSGGGYVAGESQFQYNELTYSSGNLLIARFSPESADPSYGDELANTLILTGSGSGVVDERTFASIQSIDLKGGNDLATIRSAGSLAEVLNGGSGTDTLNLNGGANVFTIKGDGTGTANGTGIGTTNATSISSFEVVNLLGGDDKATVDLLNPATAARSLLLNGGDGNDVLDIKLSDQEFAELEDTDALLQLGAYLENPTGKTLDIAFGDFTLSASEFESATFNHEIEFTGKPPTLNSVAAFASDTTSASGLEGLNLDVGGAANVQAPVTLKSTSDAITVEGNVKSDAHATEVLGISTSTLHSASDLSVGSALKSIVTGSAESTSGIAIANALVDTQHGIDLTDSNGVDALASGGSSTVISTSTLTATSTAQTVGDGSSDSGARLLDGAWSNTIAQDHLGLGSSDPTGVLTLDSESNATVSTSMLSKLTSSAVANDGLAAATSQLLSSADIENLDARVGGLGLVTAINQGVFKADATSTTDDASAMGINKASVGILDSTFTFGITDSNITAKDFNSLQVSATSTGGDAWSKLQSSSTGLADLAGNHSITDAGSISAIASDQGFAISATVSGSATAFASQEAIGMSGYEVHNNSGLTLNAQALVSSESNSSAVGG